MATTNWLKEKVCFFHRRVAVGFYSFSENGILVRAYITAKLRYTRGSGSDSLPKLCNPAEIAFFSLFGVKKFFPRIEKIVKICEEKSQAQNFFSLNPLFSDGRFYRHFRPNNFSKKISKVKFGMYIHSAIFLLKN